MVDCLEKNPPVGTKLVVVKDSGEGHGFAYGTLVTACEAYGGSDHKFYVIGPDGAKRNYVYAMSVAFASRKDVAKLLREVAAKDSEAARALSEKALAGIKKAESMEKYESDEEEVASLLVDALDVKGTKKERIASVAALLKNRIKTDMV